LIDFGLSKLYIENNSHIPTCSGKNLVGTARYASINVHKVIIFYDRAMNTVEEMTWKV